jgi:hypothetical protein
VEHVNGSDTVYTSSHIIFRCLSFPSHRNLHPAMAGPPPQIPPDVLARLMSDDQSELTIRIVVAFTVLAFVAVSLRLYTRFSFLSVGREDYTIILTMVRSPYPTCSPFGITDSSLQFFTIVTTVFQVLRRPTHHAREDGCMLINNRSEGW